MSEQELRPIPGHPDYLCGRDGSIWSTKSGMPRQMRVFVRDRSGHYGVNLTQSGRYRMHSVHRLVALAWIGAPPTPQHLVLHRNDNPAENGADNLVYGLPRDNSAQMVAHGRQASGERCARSKLTAKAVDEIRSLLTGGRQVQRDIAVAFGVSPQVITDIKLGKIWRTA